MNVAADAPLLQQIGIGVNAVEGQPFANVPVAKFTDANPGATVADFTATITWGDGAITPGTVIAVGGSGAGATFEVLGSHTYAEEGSFPISVAINDVGGSSTSTSSTAVVTDASLASQGTSFTGIEGNTTGQVQIASFTDLDPNGTLSDYTVSINWGDGTPLGSNATISSVGTPNGTTFFVTAAHTYAEEGSFQVSVTITDDGGASTIAHTTAIIGDAALSNAAGVPVSGTEGTKIVNAPVLTFSDANPLATGADFTATIDWGDGVQGTGAVVLTGVQNGLATFTVTGSHTYTDEGSDPIHVDVLDDGGSRIAGNTTATIVDAPLTAAQGIAVKAVEGQAFSNVPVAMFTDTNRLGSVADFSATINWGDGTPTSSGIISLIGGSPAGTVYQVLGSHTYASQGTFPISVVITDVGGSTVTVSAAANNSASATVADAGIKANAAGAFIQGTEGLGLSQTGGTTFGPVVIGSFTDADLGATVADFTTGGGSIVVNWGDGTAPQTLPASDLTASGSVNGVVFTITAAHVYKEEGTYQVLTTVTDSGGATALLHGQATIGDAALSQAPAQPTVTVNEETAFTLPVASFIDANPTAPLSDFKATIDWGDGTPTSLGSFSQPGGVGTPFFVTGTHSYREFSLFTDFPNARPLHDHGSHDGHRRL